MFLSIPRDRRAHANYWSDGSNLETMSQVNGGHESEGRGFRVFSWKLRNVLPLEGGSSSNVLESYAHSIPRWLSA